MSMQSLKSNIYRLMSKIKLRTWIALGVIAVLAPIALIMLYKPGGAEAEWWNDSWMYRKKILVTNNTTAENNVYIAFDGAGGRPYLDTSASGKFQVDCGDIRFTKQNGELLPYYINPYINLGCGTSYTDIDVFFDTFPAGTQVIYMYYGNSSAPNGFNSSGFATEASNYTIGSMGSEENAPGPIAWWKLDEGVDDTCPGGSNDVCDSTQNGNDGAKSNADWKTEELCLSGKCLWFDQGDTINFGDRDYLDFDRTDAFSVSLWMKVPHAGIYTLVSKQNSSSPYEGWNIQTGSGDYIYFQLVNTYGSNTIEIRTSNGLDYANNQWHHLVVTYDGSGNASGVKVYFDAEEQAITITQNTLTGSTKNSIDVHLGTRNGAAQQYEGFFDEVRIYAYARSATQVKVDYNFYAEVLGVKTQKYLSEGLVGYWKMDETSWTGAAGEVKDASGNEHNGTASCYGVGCSVPTTGAGKFSNGGIFDGNQHYVNTPLSTNNLSTPITVSAWVKISDLTKRYQPIVSGYSGAGDRWDLYYYWNAGSQNKFEWIYHNGPYISTPAIVGENRWHLVTVTHDGNAVIIFLDGQQMGKGTTTRNVSTGETIKIGGRPDESLKGNVDEVRIYNRALSEKEVKDLYNWAPGPVLHLPFDENSGTSTSYDKSGNGLNATLTSITQNDWVPGRFGSALNFDASENYATITNTSLIDMNEGLKNAVTYCAWIYARSDGQNGYGQVFRKGSEIYIQTQNLKQQMGYLDIQGTIDLAATDASLVVSNAIPVNTWNHICMTYEDDDDDELTLWINGINRGSSTAGDGSPNTDTDNILVGGGSANRFDGYIDEFKIYNYARTPQQIVEDMNAGHPTGGSPIGSQVLYWKFDEQYGTTAYDSIGNENGIVDSNLTWKTESKCKVNGCLLWDAAGEEVSIATANDSEVDFNGNEPFSGSAWVYVTTMPGSSEKDAIIAKWDDTNNMANYRLYLENDDADTTGNFGVQIYDESASQAITASQANDQISQNTWYHVAFTFNGGTAGAMGDLKLYVDGKFVGQNSTNGSFLGLEDKASDFTVGEYDADDTVATNTAFAGYIDEVKIYSSALTEDQIKIDMNAGSAINLGTGQNEANNLTDGAGNPPVAYYPMDENTGSSYTYDHSGNGLNMTLVYIDNSDWVPCKFGSCLDFDGTSEYAWYQDTTGSVLDITDAITVEAWIKSRANQGKYTRIVDKSYQTAWTFSSRGTGTNNLSVWINNAERAYTSDDVFSNNKWAHVAFTYDKNAGGTDEVKIYVNGTLVASGDYSTAIGTNDSRLAIANLYGGAYRFNGLIDEVKIYNYARTPAQIAYDYNRGKPIAHYLFDECQGTTAYDSSGNGYNGTIIPGDTSGDNDTVGTCNSGDATEMWNDGTTGKFNGSLGFDGTNDFVDVGSGPSIVSTVSFWVKPTTSTEYFIDLNGTDYVWVNNGTVTANGFGTETIYVNGKLTTTLATGSWQHVAVTTTAGLNATDLDIGRIEGVGYMEGNIDDVRIYNYALSPTQIRKVINQGAVRFGPDEGSP